LAERHLHQMDRRRALAFLPRFRSRKTRIITSAGTAAILTATALVGTLYEPNAAVADCQPNPVVCENALDGTPPVSGTSTRPATRPCRASPPT
jgi:hypothetical protein